MMSNQIKGVVLEINRTLLYHHDAEGKFLQVPKPNQSVKPVRKLFAANLT